jgi:hypothetical protein
MTNTSNSFQQMVGSWALDLQASDSYDPVLKFLGFSWSKRCVAARTVSIHNVSFDDNFTEFQLTRDVKLIGYQVASSVQKYIMDGKEREMKQDEQSLSQTSSAIAKVTERGDIYLKTQFNCQNGDKATEEELRYLLDNDPNTMILDITFTAPPDINLNLKRVFRRIEKK